MTLPQRILIADDIPDVCRALAKVLHAEGFACMEAYDGSSALSLLARQPCELVLADICMPGNEHLELVREVARVSPMTPVILMTGQPHIDTAIDAVNLSVSGYIRKPFSPETLLEHVSRVLCSGDPGVAREACAVESKSAAARGASGGQDEERPTSKGGETAARDGEAYRGRAQTQSPVVAPLVEAFLEHRLRRASKETVASYERALSFLLRYAADKFRVREPEVRLDQITSELVAGFMSHLRDTRGCGPATCATRLSAVRSFFRYVAGTTPSLAPSIRLEILENRAERSPRGANVLSAADILAVVRALDLATGPGRRDHALLMLLAQTSLSTMDILALNERDVLLNEGGAFLIVRRRGASDTVPLPRSAAEAVRAMTADRAMVPGTTEALFVNSQGRRLSRDAARAVLCRAVAAVADASEGMKSIRAWRATIPAFRKCAMIARQELV